MAISFDGATKTITLSLGTTELDVQDLWSRWVDWVLTPGDNSKYLFAMDTVGGQDIDTSAGTSIPIYVFLKNSWKIKPQEANHTLTVSGGILLVDGGGDPFTNTTGTYRVNVRYSQPVQAITVSTGGGGGGGGGASASQIADAVWDEALADHSTAGTYGAKVKKLLELAQFLALKD